jgi:hypothetical protein
MAISKPTCLFFLSVDISGDLNVESLFDAPLTSLSLFVNV